MKYFERPLKSYALLSFCIVAVISLNAHYVNEISAINLFFLAILLFGTIFFYLSPLLSTGMPYFLLFQAVLFPLVALELGVWSVSYLSILPCCFSLYYFYFLSADYNFDEQKRKHRTSILFLVSLIFTFAIWSTFPSNGEFRLIDYLTFSLLVGGIYFIFEFIVKDELFSGQGLQDYTPLENSVSARENQQLVIHDIINHTHGLNLYLSSQLNLGHSIEGKDLECVIEEIKSLQTLINDHFQVEHKNLTNIIDYISPIEAKEIIKKNCSYFFPFHENIERSVRDNFNQVESSILETASISFSVFHRIVTNLIKNCSEQCDHHELFFEVSFELGDFDFVLKTANKLKGSQGSEKVFSLDSRRRELNLQSRDFSREPLGLQSINLLAQRLGGEFNFYIEANCWINEVRIPLAKSKGFINRKAS